MSSRFKPSDFLTLARELSVHDDEACSRTAISRAYYSLFLTARDVAGVTSKKSDAHQRTQAFFRNRGDSQIADQLRDLRKARNAADYRTSLRCRKKKAIDAVLSAARALQQLQTLPREYLVVVA